MLSAAQSSALDDFIAQADPQAKLGLSKQMLEINQELGPRLKQGYVSTYWGSLSQEGYEDHVWKLQFREHVCKFPQRFRISRPHVDQMKFGREPVPDPFRFSKNVRETR